MSQYEQENDLGRGGGEVDDETMEAAWERSLADRPTGSPDNERPTQVPTPGPDSVDEAQ
jgi:hypothetical protein